MATVGLRDLYMAKITETAGVESYATPTRLAKAITAEMSVEMADGTLYADDGVDVIEKEFVKGELKLGVNDIANADLAVLLGMEVDSDGVIYGKEGDDPPYFAIGFRAKKAGGGYKYIWLLKVKFAVPEESYETKGDGINFATPEITGEFIKRNSDGRWKADYVGLPTDTVGSAWFNAVREFATAQQQTEPDTGTETDPENP